MRKDGVKCRAARRAHRSGFIFLLAAIATPSAASAENITYSELTENGRPSHFYGYASAPQDEQKKVCDEILGALNEPRMERSYDLKTMLLATPLSIQWAKEKVSQEQRHLPGEIKTAMVKSTAADSAELLMWTKDIRDAPVDTLVVFPDSSINQVRLADGRISANALLQLLSGAGGEGLVVSPLPEWKSEHYRHTGGEDGTPFSADYYWSDAILVRSIPYLLIVSPPQFDDEERLLGYVDVFIAPLSDRGIGDSICHFVHIP